MSDKKTNIFLKIGFCGWIIFAPSCLMAQAPVINYPSQKLLTLDSVINLINPTNAGGTVPNEIYGNTSSYAGTGMAGWVNSAANKSRFYHPSKIISDHFGNLYVSEEGNQAIRKITSEGIVSTFAGSGKEGKENNSKGILASFHGPSGMAFDRDNNLYVADIFNHQIRLISSSGAVSVFAGSGKQGFVNSANPLSASFAFPVDLAMDTEGNLLVVDEGNHAIRKISKWGVVSTIAGTGFAGSHDDSDGLKASFNQPNGIATDRKGNVFVADQLNHRIRKINAAGVVSTFAGSGIAGSADNIIGVLANFNHPRALAIDKADNLFVGDVANHLIRKISASGAVTTLAGSGASGSQDDSLGVRAGFYFPNGLTIDESGNLFVADQLNNKIRKIETHGYSISPEFLPKGIWFNHRTGSFGGTALENSINSQYRVSAYNNMGSSSANISFTVSQQPGNALSFDGFDDRVIIQDAECLKPPVVTVELWVNVRNINGKFARIMVKRNEMFSYDDSYSIGVDSSLTFYASVCSGDGLKEGQRFVHPKKSFEKGKWYFVAAVFRSDTMKIFVNGILEDAIYTGFPLSRGKTGMYLGFDERLAFSLDELRIFNSDRSSSIQEDMNRIIRVPNPNLVAYYNFNLGQSGGNNQMQTSLIDVSGNGNDGSLVNFKSLNDTISNWVESYALMIPKEMNATEIVATGFRANWETPKMGMVEHYLFDLSEDPDFSSFVPGFRALKLKDNQYTVRGLKPGTTYYYRVRAEKASVSGQGGYSRTIAVKTVL